MGPHGCAGRAIAITALAAMLRVCAQIKGLRRAPGQQGQLKYVPGPLGSRRYLSDDWSRYQPFAGSKSTLFNPISSSARQMLMEHALQLGRFISTIFTISIWLSSSTLACEDK